MRGLSVPIILINLHDDDFHILAEIVVFGQKVLAVVDTGASRSVFDNEFIKSNVDHFDFQEEAQATTLFSTSNTILAVIPELRIGRLLIRDYPCVALELSAVNQTYAGLGHPPILGIIGSDLLLKYGARIDYRKLKIFFQTPDKIIT